MRRVTNFALLFDVDGTLTRPRMPLGKTMAQALARLSVPFHVAAGSDLNLVRSQFLEPLWKFGVKKDFDAFVSNGAAHYRCEFSEAFDIHEERIFDFRKFLGEDYYARLIHVLENSLRREEFRLPSELKIIGSQIRDRGCMVNFSPIGRQSGPVTNLARKNREAFVHFDVKTRYRRRLLEHLKKSLAALRQEKHLHIMLGGETSFDIVIYGEDKTNAIKTLLKRYERLVFLGDALFEGGNDEVISHWIANWKAKGPCPVSSIQVRDWRHTLQLLSQNEWLG